MAPRPLAEPPSSRLPKDDLAREANLSTNAEALERCESGYIDPETGLFVLTAATLASRGERHAVETR